MKKFLMCLIFLVGFAGISSAILVGSGFDNSRVVKTEIQEYLEITPEEQSMIDNEIATKLNNKNKNKVVYDIVLFETADYRGFYTQSKIDLVNQLMNDDDPTNSIFSVYEYFNVLSYGQVSVNGNVFLYKDSKNLSEYEKTANGIVQQATFTRSKIKAETKYNNYSNSNSSMIVFSTNKIPSYDSRLWPHAIRNMSFVSLNYKQFDVSTLTHEILHNFGIADYYIDDKLTEQTPVGVWDINANSYNNYNNLMYSKEIIGWVDSSDYFDENDTAIEKITQSGTYTLQPTISTQGKRAYKFGYKQGDSKVYFMVEFRKTSMSLDPRLQTGLIVYRVNEHSINQGNKGLGYKDWQVYVYRPNEQQNEINSSLIPGEKCGGLSDKSQVLYYNDKTIAKHAIQNIKFLADGSCSFDYRNYENSSIVAGTVKNENNKPVADAKVLFDGIERTTTNENGEFVLENIYSSGVVSIIKNGLSANYKHVTVQPNTHFMTIYPMVQKNISVSFSGYTTKEIAQLYRFTDNEWVYVQDLNTYNTATITGAILGERYKVDGLDLISNEFTVEPNSSNFILTKTPPKAPENKPFIEKAIDKITDLPGQVVDAVTGAVDAIVEGFQIGMEAVKNGLSSLLDGIGGLF